MRRLIEVCILFLIVIINPYEGIDYDEILVVDLSEELPYQVKTYGPESKREYEKEYDREQKAKKETQWVYCYLCNPPQYIEIK